jgi:hypothetical protein
VVGRQEAPRRPHPHRGLRLFSRNKKRREIERALSVLEDAGRLRRETRQAERGRSAEVWIPVLTPAA